MHRILWLALLLSLPFEGEAQDQVQSTADFYITRQIVTLLRGNGCVHAVGPIEDASRFDEARAECILPFEVRNSAGQLYRTEFREMKFVEFNRNVSGMAQAAVAGAGRPLGLSLVLLVPSALGAPFTPFAHDNRVQETLKVCQRANAIIQANYLCPR